MDYSKLSEQIIEKANVNYESAVALREMDIADDEYVENAIYESKDLQRMASMVQEEQLEDFYEYYDQVEASVQKMVRDSAPDLL
jgi:hypothetical protein